MERNIGPYEFGGSLDLVEVPGMPGGMENTGAIWIGSDVIVDSYEGYFVVVHETVHQWWGDSVMFADWPHFWLAEGLDEWTTNYRIMGEFLEAQSFDELKFQYRFYAGEMCAQAHSALRFDDDDDMVDHFNGDLQQFYVYGAAALQMIEARLARDFSTDLVTVLREWYSAKRLTRVTTEDFEAFLGTLTGDAAYWEAFFDQWVYAVPCPTLVASNYSYTGGTAQFTITRSSGSGQDLMGLPIWFVTNAGRHEVRVDIPWSAPSVTVSAQPPATPTRIVVDPEGTFVFPLKRKTGAWNGPSLGLSFTPYQIPPPPAITVHQKRQWVKY